MAKARRKKAGSDVKTSPDQKAKSSAARATARRTPPISGTAQAKRNAAATSGVAAVARSGKTAVITWLVRSVAEGLKRRSETVAFAESCTGGLMSAFLVAQPGISDVYHGSIVAYSNDVKEAVLRVSPSLMKTVGVVSLPVARRMAGSARALMGTTWAVSITGIAGPGGGTPVKPVGTVCFGLRGPGIDRAEQRLFQGNRRAVQLASVETALRLLLAELE